MYQEFIYGSNAYETKPAQSHKPEDTADWLLHLGVNHPEGFVTLATTKSNCQGVPLVR